MSLLHFQTGIHIRTHMSFNGILHIRTHMSFNGILFDGAYRQAPFIDLQYPHLFGVCSLAQIPSLGLSSLSKAPSHFRATRRLWCVPSIPLGQLAEMRMPLGWLAVCTDWVCLN